MKKNLELYVHIPFCKKKCDYCDFLSFEADGRTQEQYVQALMREVQYYKPMLKEHVITSIYFGGGTPSWLELRLMLKLMDTIGDCICIRRDAEVTLECNPGTATKEMLQKYKEYGVNRLSIGLQSTEDEELKILGRIHNFEQFLKTYEWARIAGFHNINVDLISGIPFQTTEKFSQTLHRVIRLKPQHISAYSLIVEKGTPFYDRYKFDVTRQKMGIPTESLPTEDETYRIYKTTQKILKQAGYEQYEISNYAKPKFECKHNIGYWKRADYLGIGLGASSLLHNVRYTNTDDLNDYIQKSAMISEKVFYNEETQEKAIGNSLMKSADILTKKAQMEEFMFLGLRMKCGIERADFQNAFDVPIEAIYPEALSQLKKEGLLYAKEGRIALTDKGLDFSNYAMAKFLL